MATNELHATCGQARVHICDDPATRRSLPLRLHWLLLIREVLIVFVLLHSPRVLLPLQVELIVSEGIEEPNCLVFPHHWTCSGGWQSNPLTQYLLHRLLLLLSVRIVVVVLNVLIELFCLLKFLGCQRRSHWALLLVGRS